MSNYLKYYHLEQYLLDEVGSAFRQNGVLKPVDLFAIFVWKANRSKTTVRDSLKKRGNADFRTVTARISKSLFEAKDHKKRLSILMNTWKLQLPYASAILTILYPNDFTVYDIRVCGVLGLRYRPSGPFSDAYWAEYQRYKDKVIANTPAELSLRDKDRFLWAKSFWQDVTRDAV